MQTLELMSLIRLQILFFIQLFVLEYNLSRDFQQNHKICDNIRLKELNQEYLGGSLYVKKVSPRCA